MPRKISIPERNQNVENNPTEKNNIEQPTGNFIELLQKGFPNKLTFSITEAANILNLSYDFVRENIHKGKITASHFGKRLIINLFELARLLKEGVQ